MIKIVDNFLDPGVLQDIRNHLLSTNFPWYWNPSVADPDETKHTLKDPLNNFQFTHIFYRNGEPQSEDYGIVKYITEKLDMIALISAKGNLLPRLNNIEEHGYHVDHEFPCNTSILYFNTCNGYTKFEESGEKVYSIENRFVTFSSHLRHTGSSCTDQKSRLMLNINWI